MNEATKERMELAGEYLERLTAGIFPMSGEIAEMNSDLNNPEIVRSLYLIQDVYKSLVKECTTRKKTVSKRMFPLECLDNFSYVKDQSITFFVAQLKELSGIPNVKGISIKMVSDWLKENNYLKELVNEVTGEKMTQVTDAGKEEGIYAEHRRSRFGQEYEVIMYSEKAQLWLVENMNQILNV